MLKEFPAIMVPEILHYHKESRSCGSSVSIVTWLRAGQSRFVSRLGGEREFSSLPLGADRLWGPPGFLSRVYGGPWGKVAGS
jgi:hypothetical protein